jgi:thiol-disulfide isomerase/thioredoxin
MVIKFIKKNASNLLLIGLLVLLLIPQTSMPIKVFFNKLFAGNPSTLSQSERSAISNYNWNLETINGEEINLSESQGEVVLINFWATWCPPCVAEMPSLQNLFDEYGDRVKFYLVTSEEKETVEKFIQKKGYNFPVYIQKYKEPSEINSTALPTTYLISKTGEIVIKETGAAQWDGEKMKSILSDLLTQ